MKDELVTIGLVTYNRPVELRVALDCFVNQTYKNLEILICDNGSPDPRVKELCEEFASKDSRIKYYRHPQDIGGYENLRFALRMANGEYFMQGYDDDIWEANYVRTLMDLHHTGNYSMTAGRIKVIGSNGIEGRYKEIPNWFSKNNFYGMLFLLISHHWAYRKQLMAYGIVKTSVLKNDIPDVFECGCSAGWDALFIVRMESIGTVKYTQETIATKYLRYPMNYAAIYGKFAFLGPIRYLMHILKIKKNEQYEDIDLYTTVVKDCILKGKFTLLEQNVLRIANQINRIRMVFLY